MTPRATSTPNRYRPVVTALALAFLALLVYAPHLQWAPVYLYHDEAIYALNGYSIATTGRDLNGLRLPLFIHTFAWVPPIAIYARALAFTFLPVSELTTRIPGVVVAAIDVVLTYIVGRRLFQREGPAIFSAVLVILTPAHFIHARLATDHICGIPFFITSLLFVIDFVERRTLRSLCAANVCLGLGLYGYNGSMTSMPVFVALTCVMLFFILRIRTPRPYLAVVAGFMIALSPMVLWLLVHPEQVTDQLKAYDVSRSTGVMLGNGAGAAASSAIIARIDAYYNSFDPSLLFFKGDFSMLDSTREVGVFLLPIVVLLPVGAYYILRHQRTASDVFVLMGFIVAPLGALIINEAKASRVLVMVPLAAFIATRGVEALVRARRRVWRVVAIVLLCGMAIQFQVFYRDYFGEYRERSSFWFEGNREEAFERLVTRAERTRPPALFVSREIPLVNYSWRFYMLKHGRADLRDRVLYFDESVDIGGAPTGSVFLAAFAPGQEGVLDKSPALKRVMLINNADRHAAFAIYEK